MFDKVTNQSNKLAPKIIEKRQFFFFFPKICVFRLIASKGLLLSTNPFTRPLPDPMEPQCSFARDLKPSLAPHPYCRKIVSPKVFQ